MTAIQRKRASAPSGRPDGPADARRFLKNFFLHFRPVTVPERVLRFSATLALGVASTTLLFLLIATGLMLKFVYEPGASSAYDSIRYLISDVPYGPLLRNLHRWSGYALLVTAFMHLLRVFYTGAFRGPRRFNWIVGLGLFTVIVISNFTGYLLPWDQVSYWAITISTSMLDYVPLVGPVLKDAVLGGPEPGPATLMNFYAVHTAIIPIILLFLLPFHFWRIRKANGIVVPREPGEELPSPMPTVRTVPHLVTREAATAIFVVAAILAVAMVLDAPLAEQANPGLSPNPTKAPWYFMGIQEILLHFHPLFASFVIPVLITAALLCLPWLRYDTDTSGVWFASQRGRRTALAAAGISIVATVSAVLLNEWVFKAGASASPGMWRNGLLPLGFVLGFCVLFHVFLRKRIGADRNEAVQALFTLVVVSLLTLTLIGALFRGPGMQLVWSG